MTTSSGAGLRPTTAALFVTGLLWGTGGSAGHQLAVVSGMPSTYVAATRTLVGGLALLLVALGMRRPRPRTGPQWRRVAVSAFLVAAFQACYFAAVAAGSISIATLVTIGSAPVIVTVVEALTGRQLWTRTSAVVLALALIGLGLLVGAPTGGGSILLVVLLSLGSAAAFASLTIVNAQHVPGLDPVWSAAASFVISGAALTVIAVLSADPSSIHWAGGTSLWMLVLGLVSTAIPYGLYFAALPHEPATLAALLALLEPLTGTLIAVAAFGEQLSAVGWLGAALLGIAVVTAAVKTTPPTDEHPAI